MSDYQGNIIIKNPAVPTGPSAYGRAPGVWKLNEVAYWIKQGVWPDANIVPDQYFPYVSLLLSTTSLGNANNNLFVDSSGAFNPVNRVGNTTQGSFTPYGSNWSNYFDGSGDYFTVPYTTANFDWWTSGVDFTIEAWVFATNLSTWQYTDSAAGVNSVMVGNASATSEVNYWSFGPLANGTVRFKYYNGANNFVTSTATITANTWNHVAMTKTSSGITVYVNGVAGTTTAISGTPQSSTGYPLIVGQINNATASGYISNLRVVRGTAIYSGNFTPPTAPLTAVTNTKLLTCQSNRFIDNSTNSLTLTVTGNTSAFNFSPFSPAYPGISYNQSDITNWSGYFDGSGDYLTAPSNTAFEIGTGQFTLECWIYFNTVTNINEFLWTDNSGTTGGRLVMYYSGGSLQIVAAGGAGGTSASFTFVAGQWYHVAASRDASNNQRLFVNGALLATATSTNNYTQNGFAIARSASLNGYMSNVRLVKGTAVYTSAFTPPTTNLTAISGTSLLTLQNAAFTDNSTNNFVITQFGNTTVTGNSPFNTVGYWSNYFNGATSYLSVPVTSSAFTLNGDFTIEAWVYRAPSGYMTMFDTRTGGNYTDLVVGLNTSGQFDFVTVGGAGVRITTTETVTPNVWTHVACVRQGSTVKVYFNGVASVNTATYATTITPASSVGFIGGSKDPVYSTGYMSNLRLVKGTAVYTANFTPPTAPLTAISGTSLLTCQNGRFIDNSTNAFTITPVGTPSVQSFDPFYTATIASNGGSMYFDGTGDYLVTPSSPTTAAGSSDFTIECWVTFGNPTANTDVPFYGNYIGAFTTNSIYWGKHTAVGGRVAFWIYNYSSGGPLLSDPNYPSNAWNHYVITRSGSTWRMFRDGVVVATATWAGDASGTNGVVAIGRADVLHHLGYISDFRFTKGTALYTAAFTPPTAPLTPSSNTGLLVNGMNAGAYDATAINDMETVGNAQVSTAQSKFGGSSVYFDGTDDRLFIPTTPQLGFGTGDYTVEFWLYMSALPGTKYTLLDFRTASAAQPHTVYVNSSGYMGFYNGSSDVTSSSQPLSINTWYHVAYSRGSGTLKIFVAGTQAYSAANTIDYQATRPLTIGAGVSGIEVLNGYIDDLRITKGVARYTTTFTPPTQAFPPY